MALYRSGTCQLGSILGFAVVLLLCACAHIQKASAAGDAATTVIQDVTVISPERAVPLDHAWVRIDGARIAQVSSRPAVHR